MILSTLIKSHSSHKCTYTYIHTHTHIHTPERERDRDRDRENAFEGRNIILSFVYSGSTNFLTITVSEKEIFPKTN